MMKYFFLALACCIYSCTVLHADNGMIAHSYPVTGITIDGDFSDWPKATKSIPINNKLLGGTFENSSDFSATFRSGYDLKANALYIALEITDDTYIARSNEDQNWANLDSVILYIDTRHSLRGSGPQLYGITGGERELLSLNDAWDPESLTANWDQVNVATASTNNGMGYEWRIALPEDMQTNRTIGFDLVMSDRDTDASDGQSDYYAWGPNSGKSQAAGRLGDLVLLPQQANLGTLTGTIQLPELLAGLENNNKPRHIRITSSHNPELWVQSLLNDTGDYTVQLPAGEYIVNHSQQWFGNVWADDLYMVDQATSIKTHINAAETTTAEPLPLTVVSPPDLLEEKGFLFSYTSDKNQQLERVIEQYMDYYRVPGASIALVKDGKLAYHNTFGLKNYYTNEPVTDDTLFEAASITKIAFAFAVNRLAERSIIDLDKPLYQYLPFDDIAHDERYKKITARHALSHQTGFPNWRSFNEDGQIDIKFYPGIKFGYSGEGFEYLGRVVAHITGKPLEQVIMEETQIPMGIVDNVHFSASEALQKVASNGHYGDRSTTMGMPGEIGVAHSMYTEAKSFSNFMVNLIGRKGLSKTGYENMLEPQIEAPHDPEDKMQWPSRYGLGFHMMNSPHGKTIGHGGSNGDFMCIFEIYEDHDMGFIIFTNSETGVGFYQTMRDYLITGRPADNEEV